MRHAGMVQKEIVASEMGKGTTVAQFYKRHSRWVDGLLSAAKAVGAGAGLLVDTADGVVRGEAKFEELMVCGQVRYIPCAAAPQPRLSSLMMFQEIAASTAQLVSASRVKAPSNSLHKQPLEAASKKGMTMATPFLSKIGCELILALLLQSRRRRKRSLRLLAMPEKYPTKLNLVRPLLLCCFLVLSHSLLPTLFLHRVRCKYASARLLEIVVDTSQTIRDGRASAHPRAGNLLGAGAGAAGGSTEIALPQ